MVGGRAVRWPVRQVVRWSRVVEWLDGHAIGWSGGQKGPRVIRRSSLAFVWKANVFGAIPSTERITFT